MMAGTSSVLSNSVPAQTWAVDSTSTRSRRSKIALLILAPRTASKTMLIASATSLVRSVIRNRRKCLRTRPRLLLRTNERRSVFYEDLSAIV
jgi:hypothetical protein